MTISAVAGTTSLSTEGGAGTTRWTRSKGPISCDPAVVRPLGQQNKKTHAATLEFSNEGRSVEAKSVLE
ncbi:unnamed protein product [Linum trigynum]|uniref:Uncharacterized protein n=1 Tax=Linum trigynum TaxID=586398 RepID=A0AAV2DY16_9ROSI